VFGERASLADQYHEMLADRAIKWGLLGPREADRLWGRHILNSVAISELIPLGATVIDVGSGAGLPGIPLALARPDLRITLLDSQLRRNKYLLQAVEELGLAEKVSVVMARAEQVKERYDVVVARAVAPLKDLVRLCYPMINDCLLAIKGENAQNEVEQAAKEFSKRGLFGQILQAQAAPWSTPTNVVRVRHS